MKREEAIEEIKRWTPILLYSGQCTEKTSEAQDMAISALTDSNVGMSMSHRAIAKVINDYVDNHRGDSDKQYTALEIKLLLISDDSDNKGEWIEHKTKNGTVVALTCPKCLKSPKNAVRSDFCPNCGADMRGGEEE